MNVRTRRLWERVGVLAAASLIATACGDDTTADSDSGDTEDTEGGTEVSTTTPSSTSEPSGTGSSSSGSGSTTEDTGDESSGTDTDDEPEPSIPPPGGLRRLLGHQYVDSIELLLGPEAAAVADAPDDPVLATFDAIGTLESVPSPADVERYEASAAAVAEAATANPETIGQTVPCFVDGPLDDACYESLARDLGRVAWRRPLSDAQVDMLVDIADAGREFGEDDFMVGAQYMLAAILQSPRFIYIVELGDPADGDYRELDGYELAARMSFFLNGRTPEPELLDRAEAGDFDDDQMVRSIAEEMVNRPQARDVVARFYDQFLGIRRLPSVSKDEELFPTFSEELAESMRNETQLLLEDIVFQREASVLELLDADYTFVDDRLAEHYGLPSPGAGLWARTDVSEAEGRAGMLTHAGWLAVQSHGEVNSPTRRGLFVVEQLLCLEVPAPPPGVEVEPIIPDPNETLREALSRHMDDPTCSTCHALTDPLGFAFENYDPVGSFRTLDNGQPIDASGEVGGVGSFDGAAELAAVVRQDDRHPRCLVERVWTGGLGWTPSDDTAPAMDQVSDAFVDTDHRFKQLLVELTLSTVFRQVDEPK